MKTIAISQPTYLPWIGYLSLIDQVDTFVFLDTVQFDKRSWQQRNKIKTAKGLEWITVPINVAGRSRQKITETTIDNTQRFPKSHLRAIELNYHKTKWFEQYFGNVEAIYKHCNQHWSVATLNIELVEFALSIFQIETKIIRSSNLSLNGKRSELLANICDKCESSQYIASMGSKDYLINDQMTFSSRGISVYLTEYHHPTHGQQFGSFLPYTCFLDILFNEGPESINIIRSGQVPLQSIEHVHR